MECLPVNSQIIFPEANPSPSLSSTCLSLGRRWSGKSCTHAYCSDTYGLLRPVLVFHGLDIITYFRQGKLKILKQVLGCKERVGHVPKLFYVALLWCKGELHLSQSINLCTTPQVRNYLTHTTTHAHKHAALKIYL